VDNSEEPFKWGSPDLDALRGYVNLISYCYDLIAFLQVFLSGIRLGEGESGRDFIANRTEIE
jgi:hypothetical protein